MTSEPHPITIIAEAGVNHNGDLELAHRLVDAAAAAGADAVKFQTFKAERAAVAQAPKAEYQTRTTPPGESQLEMLRRLELSDEAHFALLDHCRRVGIAFLSTPFDLESLEFLTARLGLGTIKIGSGEMVNGPLLLAAGRAGVEVILSTGMADLDEVAEALGVLALGYAGAADPSGRSELAAAWARHRAVAAPRLALLHCTTEYPAPAEEANLRAMDTLRDRFGLPVGLSDHSEGITVAIAAAARGATIIEKHFTLDRGLPGPDHAASVEPDQLFALVKAVRTVEKTLGDGLKRPAASERKNMDVARKVLVASRAIARGETFDAGNLTTKRAGKGLSPMSFWDVAGRPAPRAFAQDEPIET